jgi:hypothetical protein
MLMWVHCSPGGRATLIVVETGDPLSTNAVCSARGGKGHNQDKRFHNQRQKCLKRSDASSV